MNIFGDITSDLIGKVAAEIAASKDSGVITLAISSPGGDAFAGLAVYDMLRASGLKVRTEIVGICASAASIIALAGDERAMGPNAMLMLHPAWVTASGNASELREKAEVLDAISARMGDIAASACLPECTAQIAPMMERELWLSAEEAKACGLATEITNPAQYAAQGQADMNLKTQFLAFISGKSEDEIKAFLAADPAKPEDEKPEDPKALTEEQAAELEALKAEKAALEAKIAAIEAETAEEEKEAEKTAEETAKARAEVFAAMRTSGLTIAAAEKAISAPNAAAIRAAIAEGDKIPQKGNSSAPAPSSGDILAEYTGISDPRKRQEFFAKNQGAILAAAAPKN